MHMRMMACLATIGLLPSCGSGGNDASSVAPLVPLTGWAAIRAAAAPQVALPTEFAAPAPQQVANDAWEDGIFISRDGLHLFAVYAPADLLSFVLAGADQAHSGDYLRGPTLGMDLTTIPAGLPNPQPTTWIHANIVHATRTSVTAPFSAWHLVPMSRAVWSEGAPVAQGPAAGTWDLFVYTSNEHAPDYKAHIALIHGAATDPAALGSLLPAPVTTNTSEDNPHLERLSATSLVLFFDSDDRPGATGQHDLWYTTSIDNGAAWTTPLPVTALNTAGEEEQPHLYRDASNSWWLYFTATNPADGKLGIYRTKQVTADDWNSWGAKELVLGAGNTEGVGEPTLTSNGDLSFVVVTKDPSGPATNRFDADPWFMAKKSTVTGAMPQVPGRASLALAMYSPGRP